MKNQLFVMALLFAGSASAQSADSAKLNATITVCEKDPQKVTLVISNPRNEKLTLNVSSAEYGTMVNKTVQSAEYRTNLNFSTAADGDYMIEISCRGGERIRKTVRMETREVITRTAQLK